MPDESNHLCLFTNRQSDYFFGILLKLLLIPPDNLLYISQELSFLQNQYLPEQKTFFGFIKFYTKTNKKNSMANFYTSYTKVIENKTWYFVKQYLSFPDLKNVPPILESYGMHTDFEKACAIASIYDPKIREQIFKEINSNVPQAKIIDLATANFSEKKLAR